MRKSHTDWLEAISLKACPHKKRWHSINLYGEEYRLNLHTNYATTAKDEKISAHVYQSRTKNYGE